MPAEFSHYPVLCEAVLGALTPGSSGCYIDATVGAGGHAEGILVSSQPHGRLLGIDADPRAISLAMRRLSVFGGRVTLVQGRFSQIASLASAEGFVGVAGILFDLGLSSVQLAVPDRGFSFQHDGPLDMRYDPSNPTVAVDLVNELDARSLEDILWRYGQERQARRIAQAVLAARPLHSTLQLSILIENLLGRRERIHPATRTFQALRIAVNDELSELSQALPQACELLAGGGRLAVISYHSLEDRIVKRFFQRESRDCICPPYAPTCTCGHRAKLEVITPHPLRPSAQEIAANPRSRSARLRVAARIGTG